MRTSPHPRIPCLGLLLLLVPLTAAVAAAQDDWSTQPRRATFDADSGRFRYSATNAQSSDRIDAEFSLSAARLTYAFTSDDPSAQVAMDVDFVALHEFVDGDADGAYGVGDRSVQRIPFGLLGPPTLTTGEPEPDVFEATATYPLPFPRDSRALADPPSAAIRFVFAPTSTDESLPGPNEAQYSVKVRHFPFRSNDTSLALEVRLTAKGEPRAHGEVLGARSGPFDLEHRWTHEARVDQSLRPLEVTLVQAPDDPGETQPHEVRSAFAAVPRGETVDIDPLLTLSRRAPQPLLHEVREVLGDGGLYLSALALCGLVVAAATLVRLRRA